MAQINTILEIERARKEISDYTKINLVVEGSFYRAYEWSAWLCCRYVRRIRLGLLQARSACFVAVVGATSRGAAVFRIGSTTIPATGATTMGSASFLFLSSTTTNLLY